MWPFLTDAQSIVQFAMLVACVPMGLSHVVRPALWVEFFTRLHGQRTAGLVGKDTFGEQILADCKKLKIDSKYLKATASAATSYTDVMTEKASGRRTFFHARGANALWRGENLEFNKIKAVQWNAG